MAPRVRRIVVGVVLAIAAGIAGGWWWRTPVVQAAAASLVRDRSDVSVGSPPITLPASSGASSPAPGTRAVATAASGSELSGPEERCGFEDAPQTAPGEIRDGVIVADQTKAAGPTWLATQSRIDAALRASADPFDHAVADLANAGSMRSPTGRLEALVQAASTSSDARIYSLAYRACYSAGHISPIFHEPLPPASCTSLTALRWAALDAGNGVPWLWVLSDADDAEDAATRRDALAHLAGVSRFDAHDGLATAAVLAHAPSEGANDFATLGLAANLPLWPAGLGPLSTLCQDHASGDAALASQCAAIANTMFDHSDSWALRFTGASLTVHLTGDETRRKAAREERRALSARADKGLPPSTCGFLRLQMKQMLREGQIGDLAALREAARHAGGPGDLP